MATRDAQMNLYLQRIAEGVYGKDIREAIHDGMEKSYNDSYRWYDEAIGTANRAEQKADQSLEEVSEISGDIRDIRNTAERIDNNYSDLTGRLDNIIAHNNDTEGNTELIDIRTTFQGLTLQSAGTAVRSQAAYLNGRISNLVLNNPTSQVSVNKPASVSYELLWTNSSPNADFLGQTITFEDIEDTMEMMIVYKLDKTESEEYCALVSIPTTAGATLTTRLDIVWPDTDGPVIRSRDFKVGFGSIVISNCLTVKDSGMFSLSGTDLTITDVTSVSSTNNAGLIPLRVYAVQHILDATLQVAKDTELIDARTGVDGTVYQTVGEAIRSQFIQYSAAEIIAALNDDY